MIVVLTWVERLTKLRALVVQRRWNKRKTRCKIDGCCKSVCRTSAIPFGYCKKAGSSAYVRNRMHYLWK